AAVRPDRGEVLRAVRHDDGSIAVELVARVQRDGKTAHAVHGHSGLSPRLATGLPAPEQPDLLQPHGVSVVAAAPVLPMQDVRGTSDWCSRLGRELEGYPSPVDARSFPEALNELRVVARSQPLI